jgi:hypothetical protein
MKKELAMTESSVNALEKNLDGMLTDMKAKSKN